MSRRTLILGGARFHGLELVRFFNASGCEVHVLNRGIYKADYDERVRHLIADRDDYRELKNVLKDFYYDIIIDNNAYNRSQVEILLDLVQGRCGHYIFTSTTAVYLAMFSESKLKEDEAHGVQTGLYPPKIKEYAVNKFIAEDSIRGSSRKVNFTILRFPNIFGEGDFKGKLAYFYYRLKDGGKVLLEKEIKGFNVIYVKDVVKVFSLAAGNKDCYFRTINVCEPETYDYHRFFKTVYGKLYSPDRLVFMDAVRLWEYGFHLPFAWGPMIDTALAKSLLGDIDFISLNEWSGSALDWEIERFRDTYQRIDYTSARKNEIELIKKYCNG